jgi:hypothetical protein
VAKPEAAVPVAFSDLETAFLFVSGSGMGMNRAFLDKQSGKIYWQSDTADVEEELPDDIDDPKYIEIPHKNEFGLGKPLVLDFVEQFLPGDFDEVRRIFSRRGAYGQFKSLLARRGAIDRWHQFSNKAEEAALRQWCADNAIDVNG